MGARGTFSLTRTARSALGRGQHLPCIWLLGHFFGTRWRSPAPLAPRQGDITRCSRRPSGAARSKAAEGGFGPTFETHRSFSRFVSADFGAHPLCSTHTKVHASGQLRGWRSAGSRLANVRQRRIPSAVRERTTLNESDDFLIWHVVATSEPSPAPCSWGMRVLNRTRWLVHASRHGAKCAAIRSCVRSAPRSALDALDGPRGAPDKSKVRARNATP